jgi:hypothetical protein
MLVKYGSPQKLQNLSGIKKKKKKTLVKLGEKTMFQFGSTQELEIVN